MGSDLATTARRLQPAPDAAKHLAWKMCTVTKTNSKFTFPTLPVLLCVFFCAVNLLFLFANLHGLTTTTGRAVLFCARNMLETHAHANALMFRIAGTVYLAFEPRVEGRGRADGQRQAGNINCQHLHRQTRCLVPSPRVSWPKICV